MHEQSDTSVDDVLVLTRVDTVDPRVRANFASHDKDRATWLEIAAPVDAFPQMIIDRLASHGWVYPVAHAFIPHQARVTVDIAEPGQPPRYQSRDLGYLEVEITLVFDCPDTGDWTEPDAKARIDAARDALRHFGFTKVPHRRSTWQDLI